MDQVNKIYITSYEKGVVKDLNAETNSKGDGVFHLQNFRIIQTSNSEFGGITNVQGNYLLLELPPGQIVIGTGEIRDTIILFTTSENSEVGGEGRIYTFKLAKDGLSLEEPLTLIYQHDDLGFSKHRTIEVHTIYETPAIQRVYFSDYEFSTRGFNLPDLQPNTPIEYLSLFPRQTLKGPVVQGIISGGNLNVGVIEYFYWLTTKDGKDTLISSNSKQVHLTKLIESGNNTQGYYGSPSFKADGTENNSGKAVEIQVDLSNIPISIYKYINFGYIFKNVYGGVPIIRKFETKEINDLVINTIHSGNEAEIDLDLDWYQTNSFIFDTNKTFADKGSMLFFSNVKSSSLSLDDWDTRTYRWRNFGGEVSSYKELYSEYINPYNDESGRALGQRPLGDYSNWTTEDQFKYQSDGVTLGGEGPFIKYKFVLVEHDGDEALTGGGNSVTTYYVNNNSNDYVQNGIAYPNNSFNSQASPSLRSHLVGYKRGEVYRFGLVGVKGGKTSFVKFIEDIKFPEIGTEAGYETIPGTGITTFPVSRQVGNKVKFYSLGLEFNVEVPPNIQSQIDSYFFVRVERTLENRTRTTSGVINKWFKHINKDEYYPVATIENIENFFTTTYSSDDFISPSDAYRWANNAQNIQGRRDILSFYSPEISYNFQYGEGLINDHLKVSGIIQDTTKSNRNGNTNSTGVDITVSAGWGGPYGRFVNAQSSPHIVDSVYVDKTDDGDGYTDILTKGRTIVSPPDVYNIAHKQKIKNKARISPGYYSEENPPTFEGLKIRNYSLSWSNAVNNDFSAFNGTSLIISTENSSPFLFPDYTIGGSSFAPYSGYRNKAFYIDYVRDLIDQYGGVGESALTFNSWIQCSEYMTLDNSPKQVFSGDIYIAWFEFMKNFWDTTKEGDDEDKSRFEVVMVPVETIMNLNLNFGTSFTRNTGGYQGFYYRSQENGNANGSIFQYNNVYSENSFSRKFFTKPIKFIEENVFDYRTYYSNRKLIGEDIDSWSKINPSDFIDVEGAYGPINRLIKFKDTLFYFQDKAVGYFTVDPVATVTTEEGVSTELGTGLGVQRFDYVSIESGSIHQFGVLATEIGIYFFDAINRSIKAVDSNMTSISDITGIDSWIKELTLDSRILLTKGEGGDKLVSPSNRSGALLGWDKENKEIYFTLKGVNIGGEQFKQKGDITIVYNELRKVIEGVFTTKPDLYLSDRNHLFNSFNNKIYLYNRGIRGNFEGTYYPSYVEFIISGDPLMNKILMYQEYSLSLKDGDNYVNNIGLDQMAIFNDYQESGLIDIRQKNRFRKWQVKMPRDINSVNQLARFRGDWFNCKYLWNNDENNYTLNLERFMTAVKLQPK